MMLEIEEDRKKLLEAYQRASIFQNAVGEMQKLVLNTTLVPHWIENSNAFWYRSYTSNGVEFQLFELDSLSKKLAFDHSLLAHSLSFLTGEKVDPKDLPITNVVISHFPPKIEFTAFDEKFCFDCNTSQCSLSDSSKDYISSVELLAPDGKKSVFSKDYNLWVRDIVTGECFPITFDGEKYYSYGSSPILWGMPLNCDLQASWSPDSKMIFTVQVDNRQVRHTPVVDFTPSEPDVRPTVTEYPCGYPGDSHVEEQRIVAIDVLNRSQHEADYRRVPVSRSAYGLFTDNLAWWCHDSRHAYFIDIDRGYQVARVVSFDTFNGTTAVLFEERSSTYLNLSPSEVTPATLFPLSDSNELIWFSERTGWAHFYLYDLNTGLLKHAITSGEWMVREILHFDAANRELWFQAAGMDSAQDPYYLNICRVNIDTGELVILSACNCEHTVLGSLGNRTTISFFNSHIDPDRESFACGVSPDSNYVVATKSRVDEFPVSVVLDREGKDVALLEQASGVALPSDWTWPEPIKVIAADKKTEIYGAIFRPSDFTADKHYPIIDCSNCVAEFASCPKGSFTNAPFLGLWYLQASALAELGFIVVTIDGRGTGYRNRSFVDTSYGWVPRSNDVQDRINGIKQLAAQYPYMDLDRVGIIGFNGLVGAVYGLLEQPSFYKVGVSHALQDSRLMSATWGEQYEGLSPSKEDNHYAENIASNLQGKLLLMHGLSDAMDHSAGTWRLVDALHKANKDFDMLILPSEGIGPNGGSHIGSHYAFRRTWDYFVKHLQELDPPKEFDIGEESV